MEAPRQSALEIIHEHSKYLESISEYRGYSFAQVSYSQWTIDELLRCFAERPTTPPLIIIESFRDRMKHYSCLNERSSVIFSIANDVAERIIDELLEQ